MLIMHLLLLVYVVLYGKRNLTTKYILWMFYTIWFMRVYADIATPGGLGVHNAELLLLVIATVYYWVVYRKLEKLKLIKMENESLQEQLAMYEQQVETVQEQNERVYRIKHDLKNQFVHLSSLINNGEWECAHKIIDNTLEDLVTGKYVNTGNKSLDSLINYKIALAKKKGITVDTDFFIPKDCVYDTQTIILAMGNLLDNAIEACVKLPVKERKLSIKMERKDERTLLIVSNSFDGKLCKDRYGNIKSSKTDKTLHGFGLENVRKQLKDQGDFIYTVEENLFIAKVIFYGSSK